MDFTPGAEVEAKEGMYLDVSLRLPFFHHILAIDKQKMFSIFVGDLFFYITMELPIS